MFHEVMKKRCEGTSMNRCVCEAGVLRVNEWLTWGYLMLLYLSALLKNRLALRAGVNDGVVIHSQRAEITRRLFLDRLVSLLQPFVLRVGLKEKTQVVIGGGFFLFLQKTKWSGL